MSAARTLGFALLGAVIGLATGAGLGLFGGLAYTSLADVSGFEGYSGFAVAYWILGGLVMGLVIGVVAGARLGRKSSAANL